MDSPQDVLITGCEGFIGKALSQALTDAGHRVWGVDRTCPEGGQTLRADLLDMEQTRRALAAIPQISVVVHTAALAHGQRPPSGHSRSSFNVTITSNILDALRGRDPRFLFLSSVAVYGEDGRTDPIGVDASLRPATDYGRGKKMCEELLLKSELTYCDILRLAPVYDATHTKDLRKRVSLPGLSSIKLDLTPEPTYSLCHIDTLSQIVVKYLSQPPHVRRIVNVVDPVSYAQHQIASWFPGMAIALHESLVRPFYYMTYLLPPKLGYSLRCTYWKLMKSNIYQTDADTQRNVGDLLLKKPGA